jgi:hypothetical protein
VTNGPGNPPTQYFALFSNGVIEYGFEFVLTPSSGSTSISAQPYSKVSGGSVTYIPSSTPTGITAFTVFTIYIDGSHVYFQQIQTGGVVSHSISIGAYISSNYKLQFYAPYGTTTLGTGIIWSNIRFYPTGRQGPTGATGPSGATGPPGATGPDKTYGTTFISPYIYAIAKGTTNPQVVLSNNGGTTWTQPIAQPFATNTNQIAFNGYAWVAVGDAQASTAGIAYSTDGQNWTISRVSSSTALPATLSGKSVSWNGYIWCVVGQTSTGTTGGAIYYTSDRTGQYGWTAAVRTDNSALNCQPLTTIAWTGRRFVAGGAAVAGSLGPIWWSDAAAATGDEITSIANNNTRWSNTGHLANTGVSVTKIVPFDYNGPYIANSVGNRIYILLRNESKSGNPPGMFWTTNDFSSFSNGPSTLYRINDLQFFGRTGYAGGVGNTTGDSLITTTDGDNWSTVSVGGTLLSTVNSIDVNPLTNMWVAGGLKNTSGSALIQNNNATGWYETTTAIPNTIVFVKWTGSIWIALSSSTAVYTSTDGLTWITQTSNLFVNNSGLNITTGTELLYNVGSHKFSNTNIATISYPKTVTGYSGYQELTGGMMIQWGTSIFIPGKPNDYGASNYSVIVPFATSFKKCLVSVTMTTVSSSGQLTINNSAIVVWDPLNTTLSHMFVYPQSSDSSSNEPLYMNYIAIGY